MFYIVAISGQPETEITTLENLYLNYLSITTAFWLLWKKEMLVSFQIAIEDFKPYQLNCCEALMDNKDCFVCQPAGSGK